MCAINKTSELVYWKRFGTCWNLFSAMLSKSLNKDSCLEANQRPCCLTMRETPLVPFNGRREKHISPKPIPLPTNSLFLSVPNLSKSHNFTLPMALSSLPNSIHFPTSFSISSFNTTSLHTPNTYLPPSLSTKRRLSLDIKCHDGTESKKKVNSNNSDDDDDDDDTIETISKLYKYAKKKDVVHLTKEVAIQHPEIFNSIRFLQVNMKMWNLVSNIIRGFQDSLVFSVQPTVKDGSTVGIKWKVGWDKPLMGSKKGVTIHSHHSYVGKLLIGNFGTLLDPLLQLAPMRMMKGDGVSKSKEKRIASMCLGLFLLLVSLFCFQFSIR